MDTEHGCPSRGDKSLPLVPAVKKGNILQYFQFHSIYRRIPLFHFDVYRISDPEELFNIGAEEYFYGDGVCVVEWADLIEEILPENTRYIYIEYGPKEGERIYKCSF